MVCVNPGGAYQLREGYSWALLPWQRHGDVLMKTRHWLRVPQWLRKGRLLREPVEQDTRSTARQLGVAAAAAGMFGVFVYEPASPLAVVPLFFGILLLYYGSTQTREVK